jgi:molybdopterin-guanine dinucleotide biosynthesis protein A
VVNLKTTEVVERLIEVSKKFEYNPDLLDIVIEHDDGEDLLVAIGMAQAFSNKVITLNDKGEKHLKKSLETLEEIMQDFEDEED